MPLSNYYINAVLKHTIGETVYTAPSTIYLALFTASPMADFSGSAYELSGGGYARQAISWDTLGAGTSATNDAQVDFPIASAALASPTYFGYMDALTNGNLLWYEATEGESAAAIGDQFQVPIGNLTASLT